MGLLHYIIIDMQGLVLVRESIECLAFFLLFFHLFSILVAGRITLFYGNQGSIPMTDIKATISPVNGLKFDTKPLATSLAPGEQLQQLIQVECTAPFDQPPVLEFLLS